MELDKIEQLLKRYEEGETSLAEEKLLREYFSTEVVPEHLISYQLMFNFSSLQADKSFDKKPKVKSGNSRYAWTSIAAILIVALGLFFFNHPSGNLSENDLGTISDEELALQKTKETLNMVSKFMKKAAGNS